MILPDEERGFPPGMNADQRDEELRALRTEQQALRTRFRELENRLLRWENDAEAAREDETLAAMLAETPPAPAPVKPPPLPVPSMARSPIPPPLPLVVPPAAVLPKVQAASEPPPLPAASGQAVPARESLEMQIGTTWLVRAGIVLVLTSLAFLGSYLYYHVVPRLGPVAKIALMYLGAGTLTGVGAWLERGRLARETEGLRNYARVVLAGGLAAVYYVTYSAHWNPQLRVVSNPLLAGALLLGWAAFMVWLANRRGSELLATFAILLAFYTSAVNEISSFTLVANLFLAGGAVYLLRRQLWQIFPFVSLLATFGSYGFWRFSHAYVEGSMLTGNAPPHMALTSGGFWVESSFLALYWLLFTWAIFTMDERVLPAWRRAGFVTVNNGAFFLLTTWLLAAYPGSFWKWSLGFGVVLLALAETSRRRFRVPAADTENAYLLQGVLLVTLGLIGYFSGWQLSLVLVVQSAVLLWRSGLRASRLLLGASGAVAGVSLVYALDRAPSQDPALLWTVGLAEGALLIGNAWWSQRLLETSRREGPAPFTVVLAAAPWWFAVLGSAAWFSTIENAVSNEVARAPLMAGGALLLTASIYVLRVRALPWIAQIFLASAGLYWLAAQSSWTPLATTPALWNTLLVLGSALALGHWWQWQRTPKQASRLTGWVQAPAAADALLAVVLLGVWVHAHAPRGDAGWMAEAALLSLAVLGYGLLTRYLALAAAGQLLLLVSVVRFCYQWDHPWHGVGAERWLALCPWLAMIATVGVGRRLAPAGSFAWGWLGNVVRAYEFVAVLLFLCWVERYFSHPVQFLLLCLGGGLVFALGCVAREKRWLFLSIMPTVASLIGFWLLESGSERRHWLGLVGAAVLAGQQQFGKRWLKETAPDWFPAQAQGALMTAAVCCAWAFLTARMDRWEGSAFTLAASWSLFAPLVFAVGLVLRERVYRWLGLLILAATLGHILLFDLSRLDSLGRAISSFALGLVVLGMGFFYNRYHSKFRDLL